MRNLNHQMKSMPIEDEIP
jgi:hypothetical protein